MTSKITLALAATLLFAAAPASARIRHYRHDSPAPAAYAPEPRPYSFYPYEIQGGVSGNLPFNNQVRKLSDPLNANGGR